MLIVGFISSYIAGFILQGLWEEIFESTHKNWSLGEGATVFKVTDEFLRSLNNKKIPNRLLTALGTLKDQQFTKAGQFLKEIEEQIGEQVEKQLVQEHKKPILKYAGSPTTLALSYCNKIWNISAKETLNITENITEDDLPPTHIMNNHLRHYSEAQVYRLVKIRAEQNLCQSIFTGFFLLVIINLLFWFVEELMNINYWFAVTKISAIDRAISALLLLLGMHIFWQQAIKLRRHYLHGTATQWLLSYFPVSSVGLDCQKVKSRKGKAGNTTRQAGGSQNAKNQKSQSNK